MSRLTDDIERRSNTNTFGTSYHDIPRGTAAAIDAGNTGVQDSWESSNQLRHYDRFIEEMKDQHSKVKDDLGQTELQGLKTFSTRVTPALYEGAVGQMLLSPIMMNNVTESIPVLQRGRSGKSGQGKVEDNSRAGKPSFVELKLPEEMQTTSDTRSDTWMAQTNAQIASRLWQQLYAEHDEEISKQIISWLSSVTAGSAAGTNGAAFTDASGNSHTKGAFKVAKGTWNMDTFTNAEQISLDNSLNLNTIIAAPNVYASMKKQTDFKSDEYFQNLFNYAGTDTTPRTINGWRFYVSKYMASDTALCYDSMNFATYGIMSGFNAVAEPWRDVKEQLDGLHIKTWMGFAFIDPTRAIKIS